MYLLPTKSVEYWVDERNYPVILVSVYKSDESLKYGIKNIYYMKRFYEDTWCELIRRTSILDLLFEKISSLKIIKKFFLKQ